MTVQIGSSTEYAQTLSWPGSKIQAWPFLQKSNPLRRRYQIEGVCDAGNVRAKHPIQQLR